MISLNQFLDENFNGLKLHPPLFYLWNNGLRFEIRNEEFEWYGKDNELQMKERTCTLFNSLFNDADDILFVIDLNAQMVI